MFSVLSNVDNKKYLGNKGRRVRPIHRKRQNNIELLEQQRGVNFIDFPLFIHRAPHVNVIINGVAEVSALVDTGACSACLIITSLKSYQNYASEKPTKDQLQQMGR